MRDVILGRILFGWLNVSVALFVMWAGSIAFERAALLVLLMVAGAIEWRFVEQERRK